MPDSPPDVSATELPRTYDPATVEGQVLRDYLDSGDYHAQPAGPHDQPSEPFSIVIPPPNVTAALHLGHALNNTIQDILVRHARMQGKNAVWLPGTDHAGIATQTVVDKRLQQQGEPALKDYKKIEAQGGHGRDAFIAKVQAWKDEYEVRILDQLQAMGCSCDFDRTAFTMDNVRAKAVREAFFQLFKDGLITRGKRLVNWDPVTQTALANDEVEMHDIDGNFYYMKYPLVPGDHSNTSRDREGASPTAEPEYITVATTRPETMLGDTAVAVNPNDPQRKHFIGRRVRLPIVGRIIPIIGDDHVVIPDSQGDDPKARFASGFLKVTPAHDENDWAIGQRHDLPVINVMAPDASISKDHGWPAEEWQENPETSRGREAAGNATGVTNPPGAHAPGSSLPEGPAVMRDFLGLSREEARKQIIIWFKNHDLMQEVRPYRHAVGHSYRSQAAIEPYLSDQWYCQVTDDRLAGAALQAMAPDQRTTLNTDDPSNTSRDREGAGPEAHPPGSSKSRGQAYLITFTSYGTWLHGDDRGSVDREHNLPGSPVLHGDPDQERRQFANLKHPPLELDEAMRCVTQDTFREVAEHRGWLLHAVHVRPAHCHVVVTADAPPERVMGDLKSYASRRLREAGLVAQEQSVWTRHGSTRWINDESHLLASIRYVLDHQGHALLPAPYRAIRAAAVRPRTCPPHHRGLTPPARPPPARCASPPPATPGPSRPGTKTSATGASADSSGGAIAFRCGLLKPSTE